MARRTVPEIVTLAGSRDLRRYSRHLLIPEIGLAGQERLASSRALVIGAGGLGAPVLAYLAAAGVGRIGVIDDDVVDESNLQRQILFENADIGRPKAEVSAERLHALNPQIAVDALQLRFDARNARELVRLYDVVIDCSDRFTTRYCASDACSLEGKIEIFAAIFRFDGQVTRFDPTGPCYRCLFPHAPEPGSVPTCAEGGVLGVLPGIVGAWQASEALKALLQIGDPLRGRLLLVDALAARTREVRFERDPECVRCGDRPTLFEPVDAPDEDSTASIPDVAEIAPEELDAILREAVLLDVREPHEAALGLIPGAVHLPASELEARMHELDTAKRYVVACRVGVRSRWAVARLRDAGFKRLAHLQGGLLRYAALDAGFEFF
ncbi:MAG: molybdopterin-synthase adenylyltransferase MoeB [Candidatus Eremiobacteraeota bacterium]|nr:molybdopterin-synthase adenylyltransferase MoeB [Candidatus Eremiobacteraeota bacterium]